MAQLANMVSVAQFKAAKLALRQSGPQGFAAVARVPPPPVRRGSFTDPGIPSGPQLPPPGGGGNPQINPSTFTNNPFGPSTPFGGPMPGPTAPGGPLSGVCATISNPLLRAACEAGGSLIPTGGSGGGSGDRPSNDSGTGQSAGPCGPGLVRVGNSCVPEASSPASGALQPVNGAFGLPAVVPLQLQQVRLRCPTGMVLGRDELCYPKGLPGFGRRGSLRKWKGDPKPPVTASDAKAIRRAESVKSRVKKLAGDVGFSCRKR